MDFHSNLGFRRRPKQKLKERLVGLAVVRRCSWYCDLLRMCLSVEMVLEYFQCMHAIMHIYDENKMML